MTPTDPNERAARELAAALANAAALDEDGDGIDIAAGLYGTHTTEWLRRTARALSHAAAVEGYVTVPKTLTTDMLEAGEQELAMGNDFADAWEAAIDTMLGVPSFTPPPAPAAVAGGEARVTDGMVDAYLAAQAKAVQAVDDKWGAGGKAASYLHPVREACRAGLEAALAAQPAVSTDTNQKWIDRAEAKLAAQQADADEDAYVIDRLAHLLAEISVIVNGPEPAGTKWSYHDLPEKVRALKDAPAAAPAGEAVAWLASDGEVFTDKESADRHSKVWGMNPLLTPLYTTPPAPVQAAPQEGGDSHAFKNFHRSLCARFGYTHDENDWRRDLASLEEHIARMAARPSACELGSVREALEAAARSLRTIAEQAGKTESLDDMMNVRGYANSRANVAELALQHRGDSRGGEG